MGLVDIKSYALKTFSYESYFSNTYGYSFAPSYAYRSYSSYAPLFSYAPTSYYGVGGSYSAKLDFSPKTTYSSFAPKSSGSTSKFGSLTSPKKVSTGNSYDYSAANFVRTSGVSLNNIPADFKNKYGVTEKTLADGRKVLACRWSRFDNAQREWVDTLKYFEQAAADLGCDLVYSDIERTVAESNKARAKKGSLVCKGGQSPHNYGVAADFVLFKDGKEVNVNSDLQKAVVDRAIALSGNKIESGIYWRKKGERHHIELSNWQSKYKNSYCLVG